MTQPFAPIPRLVGTAVHVPGDDIDTDRIIPARYMKVVTFDGLGAHAFHDERFTADGGSKGHPLDDPRHAGASVLLSGRNFGCGSSREHAPQALLRFGIKGILATSFAEIFFGNCTTLGIVCARVDEATIRALADLVHVDPQAQVTIDVEGEVVRVGAQAWPAQIPASAREAFLTGRYDPLATLQARADAVRATAAKLPYLGWR
ncbi:MAG: 3-isopropylmalate dehydratase small subunit [Alphaproteobacteria bacterium]|nr:3-isopropylmalate dehydratase small subunit [Alphaproteobacteria bacterium]